VTVDEIHLADRETGKEMNGIIATAAVVHVTETEIVIVRTIADISVGIKIVVMVQLAEVVKRQTEIASGTLRVCDCQYFV